MNILLIIILAVLVLCLFSGCKNGFIKTIFSLVSWIIVLVVCNIATPMVTEMLIEKTDIDTTIQMALDAKIDEMISRAVTESGVTEMTEAISEGALFEIPEELQAVLPDEIKNILMDNGVTENVSIGADLIDTSGLVNSVMGILSLLIVMVVVRVALLVVELVLGIASKIPIIGPLDKVLGLACGAGKGLIWSWVILAVVFVLALTGTNTELVGYISESQFLTWLQENNLIINLIVK